MALFNNIRGSKYLVLFFSVKICIAIEAIGAHLGHIQVAKYICKSNSTISHRPKSNVNQQFSASAVSHLRQRHVQ